MTATVNPETTTTTRSGYFPPFKVLIHNDDITPALFVVQILHHFFNKDAPAAYNIMNEAHTKGIALVGVYPKEQAEFRVDQVHSVARANQLPLTLTIEKDE